MSIHQVFPKRALTLTPRVELEPVGWLAAGGLFALAMMIGPLWLWGGDLVRDSLVGGEYDLRAGESVVYNMECSGQVVLMSCWLSLSNSEGDERILRTFWIGVQHPATVPIAPGVAPDGVMVVDYMQQALLNRWLSVAVWVSGFAAMGGYAVKEFVAGRRARIALRAMHGARLEPVAVSIEKATEFEGYPTFRYRPLGESRPVTLTFTRGFDPLAYGLAIGEETPGAGPRQAAPLALAVRSQAGGVAVLLDRELATLDLSDQERQAIMDELYPHHRAGGESGAVDSPAGE